MYLLKNKLIFLLLSITVFIISYGFLWDKNFFPNIKKSFNNNLQYLEYKKNIKIYRDSSDLIKEEFFYIPIENYKLKNLYLCKNKYCLNIKDSNLVEYGFKTKINEGYYVLSIKYKSIGDELSDEYILTDNKKTRLQIIKKSNKVYNVNN